MNPLRTRNPFHLPALRRVHKVALLSAAAVATAATTGILLNQPTTAAPTHTSSNALVMDAAIPRAADDPPAKPSPANPPAAPATPDTIAPPAAPAKAPSEKTLKIDFQFQPNYYYCGPAAVHNALSAHGANLNQDELANRLRTTVNGTDSAEDTTRVLNNVLDTDFYRTTAIQDPSGATPAQMDQLQADAVRAISNGYAVVANIINGATDSAGVWHDFPSGHYIAIVGYNDDGRTLKVADSSGMFGPSTYSMSTINMANWIATRGYSA